LGQQDQMWIFFFWLEEGPPPHSEELETGSANDLVKWKCTLNHCSKGNSRMYKIMLSIFCFGLKKNLLIQKNQKLVQQMILWSENAISTTKLMAKAKCTQDCVVCLRKFMSVQQPLTHWNASSHRIFPWKENTKYCKQALLNLPQITWKFVVKLIFPTDFSSTYAQYLQILEDDLSKLEQVQCCWWASLLRVWHAFFLTSSLL
jgi:hypothetical protein